MDELFSWRPQPTPPPLPPPVWQRQGSSLQFKVRNTLEQVVSDPQAGAETPTQKLGAGLGPAKIQEVAASQVVMSEMYYQNVLQHAHRPFRLALIGGGKRRPSFSGAVPARVCGPPLATGP